MNGLDYALQYQELGFSVLACRPHDKHPLEKTWKHRQGKRATADELREIWGREPAANVAIITGTISRLIVVDTDNAQAEAWASEYLPNPYLMARTKKGFHRYYRHPGARVGNTTRWRGIDGLDIRGDGGYVVAPPSIHPSHLRYEWVTELAPPAVLLPGWVWDTRNGKDREHAYLVGAIRGKLADACQRVSRAPDGTKHDTLRDEAVLLGGHLHYRILDAPTITRELMAALPGTVRDRQAAERTIADGLAWGESHPLEIEIPTNGKPAPQKREQPQRRNGEKGQEQHELRTATATYPLPPGYRCADGGMQRGDRGFYIGTLWCAETGTNIHTTEQTALVQWSDPNGSGETVINRADLAAAAGVTKTLGGAGAAIHAYNAKDVSRYLVEFIQWNRKKLPHATHSEYYGNVPDGMLLPAGSIGTETRYIGQSITVGEDRNAYPLLLQSCLDWATALFWGVFAFGLASPLVARLRVDRNPIVHLGGASGSGKTTIVHLATGAYGDPRVVPLQVQCGSGTTTPKGMSTALVQANGLPVFFDDIHKMLERKRQETEGIMYDFANGQNRTWGTPRNRQTAGGQEIRGLLITAGETSLSFMNAGSNNRIFSFDCSAPGQLPLGCPARSGEGMERARQIHAAWGAGAGLFGGGVCQRALSDWKRFTLDIRAFELDRHLANLQAWRKLLAIAAATLQLAAFEAGIRLNIDSLMRQWADILTTNNQAHDPASEAWERVRLLAIQSERSRDNHQYPQWHYLHYDRKLIAVRRDGQDFWRFLHTTPEWQRLIGPNAVEMFGEQWVENGWLKLHRNGRIVSTAWMGSGSPRCLLVTREGFHDASHDDEPDS